MWKESAWNSSLELLRQSCVTLPVKHRTFFNPLLPTTWSYLLLCSLYINPSSLLFNPRLTTISGHVTKQVSHQHGFAVGAKVFYFKVTSTSSDLNMTSLQTGEKSWHYKGLNQKSYWLHCGQNSMCPASPFIFLEKQNEKCTFWHCWSHSAGISAQLWRKKITKWGAEEKSCRWCLRAGVLLITCHIYSFTLLFCTIFHRVMRHCIQFVLRGMRWWGEKNFHVVRKVSRRKENLFFSSISVF